MAEVLALYPSKSKVGKNYEVREGKDGVIYCTCWQWRKNKTCKHLEHYHANGATLAVPNSANDLDEAIANAVQELTA